MEPQRVPTSHFEAATPAYVDKNRDLLGEYILKSMEAEGFVPSRFGVEYARTLLNTPGEEYRFVEGMRGEALDQLLLHHLKKVGISGETMNVTIPVEMLQNVSIEMNRFIQRLSQKKIYPPKVYSPTALENITEEENEKEGRLDFVSHNIFTLRVYDYDENKWERLMGFVDAHLRFQAIRHFRSTEDGEYQKLRNAMRGKNKIQYEDYYEVWDDLSDQNRK